MPVQLWLEAWKTLWDHKFCQKSEEFLPLDGFSVFPLHSSSERKRFLQILTCPKGCEIGCVQCRFSGYCQIQQWSKTLEDLRWLISINISKFLFTIVIGQLVSMQQLLVHGA